jgi:alkylation response protein AidB-like acyl-CoA dehydrogenase
LPLVTASLLGVTAVPLGIARASIDALVALAATKVPAGTQAPLREHAGVQADVARAETLLRTARAYLFEAVGILWESALAGETPTWTQRAHVRMAMWNVAHGGKEVVELMYSAAGATATSEEAPFAAQLRDVHAAGQHIAFANRNMETAGRILFGMEPGTARF